MKYLQEVGALMTDTLLNEAFCGVVVALIFCWFILEAVRPFFSKKGFRQKKHQHEEALEFLKRTMDSSSGKGRLEIARSDAEKHWDWLLEYVLGELSGSDAFHARLTTDGKKVLLRLPADEIIQSLPRDDEHTLMPSLLTAIGVLGTFTGITMGLSKIDLNTLGNNVQQMTESVVQLIGGMKTAFVTSLAGLGAAALVILFSIIRTGKRNWDIQKLREKFDMIAKPADPLEALLYLASPERREADAQQLYAAKEMGSAAKAMNESLSGFNAEVIGDRVAEAIRQALENRMMPTFEDMKVSLVSIQQRMENQNEDVLQSMIIELRKEVIQPMSVEIVRGAQATQNAADAVNALQLQMTAVADTLGGTVEKISICGDELVEQSKKLLESKREIQELLEAVGMHKAGVFQQLQDAARHVSTSVAAMENKYSELETLFLQSQKQIKETIASYASEAEKRHLSFFEQYDEHSTRLMAGLMASADALNTAVEDIRTRKSS